MNEIELQKEYNQLYHNYECDYAEYGDREAIKEMVGNYGVEACKKIERINACYCFEKPGTNNFEFQYQLLSRLKTDCDYYLGCGRRNKKCLWALDEKEQIEKMKELWNEVTDKPEWLTMDQILSYEKQICM